MADGNIIVNAGGGYSRWDDGIHEHNFRKIRGRYAIGDPAIRRSGNIAIPDAAAD